VDAEKPLSDFLCETCLIIVDLHVQVEADFNLAQFRLVVVTLNEIVNHLEYFLAELGVRGEIAKQVKQVNNVELVVSVNI
jgi:hypothetical protein